MQTPCDYQLALADYWEGRQAMEPTAWVPGLPLEMTVPAPASNSLVLSSSGQQQLKLVEQSSDHEYVVEVFKEAAKSFMDKHDQIEKKIHLFPASMEDLAGKYKAPKVVSIGPYYHGRTPALRQMESTKHVAAWHFINNSEHSLEEVYGAVCEVADKARSHYDEEKLRNFGEDDFKPMMFYDGCFLLQFMLLYGGGTLDPVLTSAFSSIDSSIWRDVLLLENQLPWVVVDKLMNFMPTLNLRMFTGMVKGSLQARQKIEDTHIMWDSSYTPPHLLGLLQYYIVGSTHITESQESSEYLSEKADKFSISVSAIELAEIGIEITAAKSTEGLNEMRLDTKAPLSGKLILAPVSLDDGNASLLVNMAALELCTTPDFLKEEEDEDKSTVCSYLGLLGMVTDNELDVQELRKKHILQGGGGLTNKDALDLFTSLEKHLRTGSIYFRIMSQIENYRIRRPVRTKVYRFGYRNWGTIAKVGGGIVGFAGLLATIKSLGKVN